MKPIRRAVVLAAGKGTRMHSSQAKVLAPLIDRPLLAYAVEALEEAGIEEILIVAGHRAEDVKKAFPDLSFVIQEPQLGTGHAVMQATPFEDLEGLTLVLNGDGPLITADTIRSLFDLAESSESDMIVLSTELENPGSYGRIIRDADGSFREIVEARDASEEELAVREINSGIYCFNNRSLFDSLSRLERNNAQNEYYLTDVASILKRQGAKTEVLLIEDSSEVLGINTCIELEKAFRLLQERINRTWMEKGVAMERSDQVIIGKDVLIGRDVLIQAGTRITGKSRIEDGAQIRFGALIHNSTVKKGSIVEMCTIIDDTVHRSS